MAAQHSTVSRAASAPAAVQGESSRGVHQNLAETHGRCPQEVLYSNALLSTALPGVCSEPVRCHAG